MISKPQDIYSANREKSTIYQKSAKSGMYVEKVIGASHSNDEACISEILYFVHPNIFVISEFVRNISCSYSTLPESMSISTFATSKCFLKSSWIFVAQELQVIHCI